MNEFIKSAISKAENLANIFALHVSLQFTAKKLDLKISHAIQVQLK